MQNYRVHIEDITVGYWDIEANSEEEAREFAQTRLENGSTSWQQPYSGAVRIYEVEVIK